MILILKIMRINTYKSVWEITNTTDAANIMLLNRISSLMESIFLVTYKPGSFISQSDTVSDKN